MSISSTAVLGPILATPGTLSEASPNKDRKSTMWADPTPIFSLTSLASHHQGIQFGLAQVEQEDIVVHQLHHVLVAGDDVDFHPQSRASQARVAITSSAS